MWKPGVDEFLALSDDIIRKLSDVNKKNARGSVCEELVCGYLLTEPDIEDVRLSPNVYDPDKDLTYLDVLTGLRKKVQVKSGTIFRNKNAHSADPDQLAKIFRVDRVICVCIPGEDDYCQDLIFEEILRTQDYSTFITKDNKGRILWSRNNNIKELARIKYDSDRAKNLINKLKLTSTSKYNNIRYGEGFNGKRISQRLERMY